MWREFRSLQLSGQPRTEEGCVCVCVRILPAADHSLAGERQVQTSLSELEGESVLQRLSVYDERQLVLLPQRLSQGGAVGRQGGTRRLQGATEPRSGGARTHTHTHTQDTPHRHTHTHTHTHTD